MNMNNSLGKIDFCPNCRRTIDAALDSENQGRLYIMINNKVKAPYGRVPISICNTCRSLLQELKIDGFEVMLSQ
jgi:hypothetical protein